MSQPKTGPAPYTCQPAKLPPSKSRRQPAALSCAVSVFGAWAAGVLAIAVVMLMSATMPDPIMAIFLLMRALPLKPSIASAARSCHGIHWHGVRQAYTFAPVPLNLAVVAVIVLSTVRLASAQDGPGDQCGGCAATGAGGARAATRRLRRPCLSPRPFASMST